MSRRQFEPISAVLPDVLVKAVETGASAATLGPLWASAVGAQIAAKSQPVSLRRGELLVEVSDERWLPELERQRGALLARFREERWQTLNVNRISFRARR
ncbi:MAG: DUF721 domain-containing protein [Myxococcaceae bacterium]|nr:DUF721 domain-containing protein [Myxococcaceae bacterium]